MPKVRTVLLIDDNEADNMLHTLLLEEAEFAEQVVALESGAEALTYLAQEVDGRYPQPDLVFVDLNMPRMTGWEFLEKYSLLPEEARAHTIIVILTTSLNPRDEQAAHRNDDVKKFLNKPLDVETAGAIVEELLTS